MHTVDPMPGDAPPPVALHPPDVCTAQVEAGRGRADLHQLASLALLVFMAKSGACVCACVCASVHVCVCACVCVCMWCVCVWCVLACVRV